MVANCNEWLLVSMGGCEPSVFGKKKGTYHLTCMNIYIFEVDPLRMSCGKWNKIQKVQFFFVGKNRAKL